MCNDRADTLHNRLIDVACQNGWSRDGWRAAVRARLKEEPWSSDAEDVLGAVAEVSCVPDAWRIRVEHQGEGPEWNYDVLVVELLEVEVTNPIDQAKLVLYERLWWAMDGSSLIHFRVFRMDRYGFVLPFMTESTAVDFVSRHRPGGHEPIWYMEFANALSTNLE